MSKVQDILETTITATIKDPNGRNVGLINAGDAVEIAARKNR